MKKRWNERRKSAIQSFVAKPSKYTPEEWAQCRLLFETTNQSVRTIADKTGIRPQAIESKLRRHAWKRPDETTEAKLVQHAQTQLRRKIENKAERKAEALTERANEFRNQAINASFRLVGVLNGLCDKLETGGLDAETLADCAQKATSAHNQLTHAAWKQFGLDTPANQSVKVGLFLPVEVLGIGPMKPTIEIETVATNGNSTPPSTENA